jgi:hypothetical protein
VHRGDTIERRHRALHESRGTLAICHDIVGKAFCKKLVLLRKFRLDLGVGETLENAETAFAQTSIGDDVVPGLVGYAARCLMRASEVAALERREFDLREPASEPSRLVQAGGRERAVVVALHAALLVPQRLAMAHEEYFSHRIPFVLSVAQRSRSMNVCKLLPQQKRA